ncbi:hypothetical protein AHF37_08421 [Paragonimus kellicotti]|nr:hypothetical protein AHF37_08421 [Paragonimus kellicotti]
MRPLISILLPAVVLLGLHYTEATSVAGKYSVVCHNPLALSSIISMI